MQTLIIDYGVKSSRQTGIPQPKRRGPLRILHTMQPGDSFVVDRQLDAEYALQLGTELRSRMKLTVTASPRDIAGSFWLPVNLAQLYRNRLRRSAQLQKHLITR
jgi:hypothetical protein